MSSLVLNAYQIVPCTEYFFEQVKAGIEAMWLDNRCLEYKQFLVAIHSNNDVLGFGRIREYPDCSEICSVGVFEAYRNQGIGKSIVKKLIEEFLKRNDKPIYVITVIPKFFEKLNFKVINEPFPKAIQEKLDYCIQDLPVPEAYVVMRFNPPPPNR
ncbi:MAG: hypothetical protein KatS3mg027_0174 [Bacteroidia bacterium]|nr:MAG: hypothetical protein KatS3mg027_0174 [Bacteroidia bacterium]